MKKTSYLMVIALIGSSLTIPLWADSDRHEYGERGQRGFFTRMFSDDRDYRSPGYLQDPLHEAYVSACSDCHMAYPPTMLPQGSWHEMMNSLADHFGDNAEMAAETQAQVTAYLERNAAGPDQGRYSSRIWRSVSDQAAPPQRITETAYFRGKHHELSERMVEENPDVGSFSRCDACHGNAALGNFNEHEVRIPGYGRWDD